MSPLVGERTSGPTVASAALSYKNQIGYTYAFGETGMMIDDLIEAVIAREGGYVDDPADRGGATRKSEEHTSELQSLMRISYAVFCLKKKNKHTTLYLFPHQNSYHNYMEHNTDYSI